MCQNVNMKRNVNMNWNLGMYVGIYVWICAGMYVRMGIGNTVCWVGLGMWYFWYYCGWEALVDLECLCELICVLRHWWWFLISTFWFLISHNHDFWFWGFWSSDFTDVIFDIWTLIFDISQPWFLVLVRLNKRLNDLYCICVVGGMFFLLFLFWIIFWRRTLCNRLLVFVCGKNKYLWIFLDIYEYFCIFMSFQWMALICSKMVGDFYMILKGRADFKGWVRGRKDGEE